MEKSFILWENIERWNRSSLEVEAMEIPPSEKGSGLETKELIKVDFDTPPELFFSMAAFFCLVFAFYGSFYFFVESKYAVEKVLVCISVLMGLLFLLFRYFLDDFYIIDPVRKGIFRHFSFFFFRTERSFLPFSNIDSVGINWFYNHDRGLPLTAPLHSFSRIECVVVVIDSRGKIHPFSNPETAKETPLLKERVQRFATLVGCPVLIGPDKHRIVLKQDSQGKFLASFEPVKGE